MNGSQWISKKNGVTLKEKCVASIPSDSDPHKHTLHDLQYLLMND